MIRWAIFIGVFVLIDFYAYQAVRTTFRSKGVNITYIIISLAVLANFIYQIQTSDRSLGISTKINLAIGLFLTLYIPKILIMVIMFGEDIIRLPQACYKFFTEGNAAEGSYLPSRRMFISQIALGLAAIPFASFLYGMVKGKYNFKVLNYTLHFDDLPEAFDGYKITHISDIHSGSFDNKEKVEYAVDLVNEQESNIILFTGDLVNNTAKEMIPWQDTFKRLKAEDGIFSIFGNHDYGDYVQWNSEEDKKQNLEDLKTIQKGLGFNLLLNESRFIKKKDQRIAIVGVENWGRGFKQKGDLKKAAIHIEKDDFKILLSHDPTHWQERVIDNEYHYHLTLSGHTHGMQFGIEIPGFIKWSPVKWRYKYWAGIYKEKGQYINVNRGLGYLAFPGRVGIWPEITVIELKKGSNSV
ncbi:metallophosphoesterase [Yeosuana sp. MJ-SS3]|jgi:predicted MPP superfamily phosphohydrolase|uniref:Metallophosphoesterase n=1 Tax=Gilvirhabdus luticola TaxID=3079858 RepID=A0ABU3U8D5_9FLAO|nr:metallophosphoesterase [Yeosuana sp. MJ-SS3]MDU8886668.1 metallophosphoesterase [Yeosuana sp. MJ-SS3]